MKPSDHFPALKLAAADTFRWLRWQAQAALLGPTMIATVVNTEPRDGKLWLSVNDEGRGYFKHAHGMEIDAASGSTKLNLCAPLTIHHATSVAIVVKGHTADLAAICAATTVGDVCLYHVGGVDLRVSR